MNAPPASDDRSRVSRDRPTSAPDARGAVARSAVAGIAAAAVSFVVLAHPTTPLVAIRELPGVLFLSALATGPGTLAVGLLTVTLGPRSRLFRPGTRVLAGGVIGLVVLQCWGYLFGDTLLHPDWERHRTLLRVCAIFAGGVAMATAGALMRTAPAAEDGGA